MKMFLLKDVAWGEGRPGDEWIGVYNWMGNSPAMKGLHPKFVVVAVYEFEPPPSQWSGTKEDMCAVCE